MALGGPKQRVVLAALLTQRGRSVSVAALATAVWEDRPPADYPGSLQVTVSALRRVLTPLFVTPLLVTVSGGYRLDIPDELVDVARFRRDSADAGEHFTAGRFPAAAQACARALHHWRGRALQDLHTFRFAVDVATALEEELLAVRALRIDSDLACGQHASLVAELSELTTAHPLNERFWGQMVVALYRADRQADALSALRRVRELLDTELGVDPGPALQDLERRVLRHEMMDTPAVEPAALAATVMDATPDSSPRGRLVDAAGRRFDVPATGLTIGRAADNLLVVADDKVSRHHGAVTVTATGLVVSDLRSTNGIWVNDVRVSGDRLLDNGDVMRVGGTEFIVEVDG